MIWQLLLNLPGWRWATITKVALDRLSRSLHSDVCDSDGCRDAVVHSRISGRGNRRFRAVPNYFNTTVTVPRHCPFFEFGLYSCRPVRFSFFTKSLRIVCSRNRFPTMCTLTSLSCPVIKWNSSSKTFSDRVKLFLCFKGLPGRHTPRFSDK